MNSLGKYLPARRALLALGLAIAGLTTGAHAQNLAAVNAALADLYTSGTTVATASTAQLQEAIELIAAPTGTTIIAPAPHNIPNGHAGLNSPGNVAADITAILQNTPVVNVTATVADNLVDGFLAEVTGSSSYLAAVTAAAAANANFERTTDTAAAIDAAEKTIVSNSISKAPSDFVNILVQSLQTTDPLPTAQAALFVGEATSANLAAAGTGGTTMAALSTQINSVDASYITNVPLFLESVVNAETSASGYQQTFLQGYTAGESPSQLATTATNIINLVPSIFSAASRTNVFTGLVTSGSISDLSGLAAIVNGVATGVMQNYTLSSTALDDAARATLTSDLITAMGASATTYANGIASSAVGTLGNSLSDVFAFTSTVLANTIVTTNGLIPSVTQAISNTFSAGNLTDASVAGQAEIEAVAEAGIKADPGAAGTIASDVANNILTSGSAASAKVTFAANFIGAIDKENSNFPAINAADRANAAIGVAETFNSIPGLAVAVSGSAVASYSTTVLDVNSVAQPILDAFSTISGTETGAIAAQIAQTQGTYTVGTSTAAYTPAYLAAQLILAAKITGVVDYTLVDQIALGTAASSGVLSSYSGSVDTYLTQLAGDLNSVASLPFLGNVETYLASVAPYSDTQIMTDFATSGGAPLESGTLAAILTGSNSADATKIAYAAANGTGVTTDSLRDTIAEDVVKEENLLSFTDTAVAISGSVGTLISIADKPAFAEALARLDTVPADDSNIVLNTAQSIPANDSTINTDFEAIAKDVLLAYSTANKNLTNVSALVYNLLVNYTGSLSNHPGSLGYQNIATIAGGMVTGEAGVTGLGNALAGELLPVTIGSGASQGTAVNVATIFASKIPGSYVVISSSAAALDSTISSDAGSLTSGILGALGTGGKTDAPAVALALAQNANGGLTAPEAEAIADTAGITSGITLANEDLVATNVIGVLDLSSTSTAQTALNVIANTLSGDFVGATAAVTLTDQESLATALAKKFPLLDQASIAYYVANVTSSASSYTDIAAIATSVLKATTASATTPPSISAVNSLAGELVTDFTGNTNTNYAQAAGIGSKLAGDLLTVTGAVADLSQYLTNQELAHAGGSITNAESIAAAFTTDFPTTAVAIATETTNSSLYTSYTAEESGSIAAVIANNLPSTGLTTTNPTISGSISVIAALAPGGSQTVINDSLQTVAGVFAANAPATDDLAVQSSLATSEIATAGTTAALHNMTIPSIVAAFAPGASETTIKNVFAKLFGNAAGDANDFENIADVYGAALTYDWTILQPYESALVTAIDADVTTAVLQELINSGGVFAGKSATAAATAANSAKGELNYLLGLAEDAAAASSTTTGAYGNINANETPIVNM